MRPTFFKSFIKRIIEKPSLYFFVFLIIFTIDRHHRYEQSKEKSGTFYSDVYEYYRFLPDIFIKGPQASRQDIKVNKRTIGMAILYSPAFLVGHLKARLEGEPTDGYSLPYQWSIRWGTLIYMILGLYFCRKSLLFFFNEMVTMISLICILFGTNLFYYSFSWGELPHSYLFCLNAAFIYCVLSFLSNNKKSGYLPAAGLIAGMITLIRPTGAIVLLFPLLYNVYSWQDFMTRLKLVCLPVNNFITTLVLFCLPLLAQMLFWKNFVGSYIFYSYGQERFFFNDPQIVNFLFSYRKGWLVYTPIMCFALIGMVLSWRRLKPFFLFNILFFALVVYILSSWWEWSFGGSFGCRALVEYYAFFIFPFAAFVAWFWDNSLKNYAVHTLVRAVPVLVFYLLILLNFFQSKQTRLGIIHWSGMNKEAYWYCFLKDDFKKHNFDEIHALIKPPDPEKMMRGERDF